METDSGLMRYTATVHVAMDEVRKYPELLALARTHLFEGVLFTIEHNGWDTEGEVRPIPDRYGRFVETYPPGMATTRAGDPDGGPDIETELPEPLLMFLDCREEVADYMIIGCEVDYRAKG